MSNQPFDSREALQPLIDLMNSVRAFEAWYRKNGPVHNGNIEEVRAALLPVLESYETLVEKCFDFAIAKHLEAVSPKEQVLVIPPGPIIRDNTGKAMQ